MQLKDKIEDIFPLTPLQKGLLFHSLYEPESGIYFEQFHCRLEGDVSVIAVRQAWQTLVDRHPILRTAIITKGQTEPVQVVFRDLVFNIIEEDWRGLSKSAQENRLTEFLEADRKRGFILNRPPLMRVTLIRLGQDSWHLVWSHHHLILDGWSWPILLREFLMLHKAAKENVELSLPNVRPYGDFIAWLKQKTPQEGESFWREYMNGFESATPLSIISKNKPGNAFIKGEIKQLLSSEVTDLLQKLAQNCSITLNTVIQGAWAILLNRYSRNQDIVYGITVAGRPPELPGVEGMIGPFINTLPLRVLVSGEETLENWLQNLQARAALMRQFEHSSLSDIQAWSDVPRGEPLFESLLAFENFPVDTSLKAIDFGLNVPESSFFETTHYPLTLVVVPGDGLSLKLSYNAARFDAEPIELLLKQFRNLLINMANNAQEPLQSLSLNSQLIPKLRQKEQTVKPVLERKVTLREIFAETVSKYPQRIALTFEDENLTYQELDSRSNRIARYLQKQGIGAEKRVVICLERSPELIIAMLGVVKAGGVYVPVDPAYPRERIEFTISDCGSEFILTTKAISSQLPESKVKICLDDEKALFLKESTETLTVERLDFNSGAYIIYTSGSTGQPKGVLISQHNVTRLFRSTEQWFGFNEQDVWTFFHSFAFDFSVWEIWGALLYGGRLVIVPYCVSRNPESFAQLLQHEKVTVLNQTPSAFAQLLASSTHECNLSSLRYIIFGGEALNLPSLHPWFERYGENQTRLVNMYGITETTVHVTYRLITKQDIYITSGSLIGQPIPDLRLYILDPHGNPLPPGVIGEIYIGGAGVARGYINRPKLTAERFVKDYFADPSSRLYRSGDLGRFLPNGDLEYLGRIDHQVKIRGFRIEIGEIEAAISQFPEVQEAIVLIDSDPDTAQKHLIAYIVCQLDKQPTIETLRNYLQQKLPDYMIPSQIVYLERFPLTPNGKIERKALPKPEILRKNLEVPFIAPATGVEEILAKIWQQVLGVEQVSRFDNYFVLGGDSIRSIRIASLAQSQGINLKIEQIFSHPVLSDLAELLTKSDAFENQDIDDKIFALISSEDKQKLQDWADNAYPLAQLQTGMFFHSEYSERSTTYHDVFSFRIRIPFDLKIWEKAYAEMFTRHSVLRTAFYLAEFSQPIQVVLKQVPAKVEFENLTNLSSSDQDSYIRTFIGKERENRFDYKSAPLMRFHIHLLDKNVMQATFTLHHAIMDGWSLANFLSELTGLYLHLMNRSVPALPPAPKLEYSRFIALEQQALKDEKQREFWRQQITSIPFTQLPRLPRTDSLESQPRIGKIDIVLPDNLSQGLKDLAHQLGLPLRTVLLALHLHVLAAFSGEKEIVTGLVSNSRPSETDSDRILGLFLNTLPLRLKLPRGTWVDLIQETWRAEQALMPNRRFPLAELQRLNGNQPFYETSFNFVHFHVYKGLLAWREVELIESESLDETNIPFAVSWSEEVAAVNLALNITYDSYQFDNQQISFITKYYQQSIEALIANPQSDRIKDEIHHQPFFDIPFSPAPSQWVHEIISQQAAKNPDATAVIFEGKIWTYAELNQKANQLARFLLSGGIILDKAVGVCLQPSLEMVCALLAVLKVGGCYVPIDPQYPTARIQSMLQDAKISLLLSHSDLQIPDLEGSETQVILLDRYTEEITKQSPQNLDLPIFGDNIAYIIFTSGSTGRPKGIAISHQSLACHMDWFIDTFNVNSEDVVFQKTSFSFDASVDEFWAPLMVGAKLLIGKQGAHQDPAYLIQKIKSEKVTLIVVVPSLLEVLLTEPGFSECSSLRLMFSGGEALKTRVWEEFNKALGIPLVNIYGPAETTVESVYHSCRDRENTATIPIGKPVNNTRLYILNSHLQPVPVGTPGELFISGYQLARGYWDAPRITAERFLPDPFAENAGTRMYQTGDRARYLPDGNIEFLGRADQQVKIRGFRIETGEIVAALEKLPWVIRAVTKAFSLPEQPNRLIAYVELKETLANWQKILRLELAQTLPNYMIPALFIKIEAWSLLPNGKIDINALPDPEAEDTTFREEYIAPQNETERILTNLWEQVLQIPRIGVIENFFELGGDSIMGLQIIAKARDLGLYFTPQDLFNYPQVGVLASHVKTLNKKTSIALPKTDTGEVPLTPIQNWFFQQSLVAPQHWNQSILLDVKPEFQSWQFHTALNQIAKSHPAFRLRFRQTETGWIQEFGNDTNLVRFDVIDITDIPQLELSEKLPSIATRFQGQLNLENGSLFRAVYFQTEENAHDKLLLIIHHLIVDGVSWRIILQDLAYGVLNSEPKVSTKSASFPQWSYYLQQITQNDDWEQEANFWKNQTANNTTLPLDFPQGRTDNKESSISQIECNFSKEETDSLLLELPRTRKARIQEVLLTALLLAVTEWTGDSEIIIALESHGREALTKEKTSSVVDVSDAVGWFTSLFPCKLEKTDGDILNNLETIKEHLRNLLSHSFSYGILSNKPEYSSILPPVPQGILFNYLGQFDEAIPHSAPFTPSIEDVGSSRHPENQRTVQLEITGLIVNKQLQIRFVYSQSLHKEETIRGLVNSFNKHLHNLLTASRTQQHSWIPEDFPLAKLNSQQLAVALAKTNYVEDIYPLSPVQEGILFHTKYELVTDVYIQQVSGEIHGKLDVEQFKKSWEFCINRYPNLRASFVWQDLPRPLQRIHYRVNLPFIYEDWCEYNADEIVVKWSVLLTTERQQSFSTETAPLMRMTLVKTEAEKWRFCWNHHHLLLDGWSLPLIFRDVIAFYQTQKNNQVFNLPQPPDYRDFIVWLNQKDSKTAQDFWRKELNGLTSATSFGLTSHKSNTITEYENLQTTLTREIYTQLKAFAQKNQVTLNTLVQAAWGILLSKYSGSDQVVYGVTVSGRSTELSGFAEMVGLFINTLPLRLNLNPARLLKDWLIELRDRLSKINEYSFTPLVDIQACSDVPRGEALFESILVYENYPVEESLRQNPGELAIHSVESLEKNHYPISLYALPGDDLTLKISFQPHIGSAYERESLLYHLTQILTTIATEKPQFLGDISLLSRVDIGGVNQSISQLPVRTIHELFSRQAQKTPDAIAVFPDITYTELERKSNDVAHALLQLNVTPETLVAVFLERHAGLPIALLGIMKAGSAYLPLDPTFPRDRISWMLTDSSAAIIITEEKIATELPPSSAKILLLDSIPPQPDTLLPTITNNNHLAYLIYTSGSTGKPKGVQIHHESVVNFLLTFQEKLQLTASDTLVAVTTISFDIAGLELFLPLISGARLVIADKETTRDGFKLTQLLHTSQATIMQATPTTWRLLLTAGWEPSNGFSVLCGGEAMPIELAASILKYQVHLWNVYGPTETTIWSTIKEIKQPEDALSIGKEIANTSIYILDTAGNPVPEGIVGELLIGGIGLSRGYWQSPDITAKRFIPNPFAVNPGERLYHTGDLARWLPNGEIEFLGRIDYQVKIRGFRIELGEIETALENHPAIAQAIVQAIDDTVAGKKLVGYLVIKAGSEKPTFESLQSYLLTNLPNYMLPSAWVFLDAMPLTPNNKVDRKALPLPDQSVSYGEYTAPRNSIEEALTYLWQEVLSVDKVGVMDNFFHLGGHSLLAAQVHARIRKVFLIDLELRELFDTVTIEKMAELLLEREPQFGRTEKIAKTFLRLKQMTPEEKAKLLQEKRKNE